MLCRPPRSYAAFGPRRLTEGRIGNRTLPVDSAGVEEPAVAESFVFEARVVEPAVVVGAVDGVGEGWHISRASRWPGTIANFSAVVCAEHLPKARLPAV